MNREQALAVLNDADLYVVITESFCAGRSSLQILEACLDAGVKMVQLREKNIEDDALFQLACAWRDATRNAGALLFLDDRVDIALAVQADGVHLGLADMPIAAARRIAPELLLGASSHTRDEALAAQQAGADYVNIGPIFPTQTKAVPTGAVGPRLIADIAPQLRIPFTCMGGITLENVDTVLAQGARIAAVVTAVTAAENPTAAAAALRERIRANRKT